MKYLVITFLLLLTVACFSETNVYVVKVNANNVEEAKTKALENFTNEIQNSKLLESEDGIILRNASGFLFDKKPEVIEIINIKNNEYEVKIKADIIFKSIEEIDTINDFEINGKELVKYNGKQSSVSIPDGIEIIGFGAFFGSMIKHVYLPKTIRKINDYAFYDCELLTYINLEDNIDYIGIGAFANTNLNSIKIPTKISVIREMSFKDSHLETLIIPSNIKKIESYAFSGNSFLSKLIFMEGVEEIEKKAFSIVTDRMSISHMFSKKYYINESLFDIELPKSLIKLGEDNFSNFIGIRNISLGKKLKKISDRAFSNDDLNVNKFLYELNIPDNIIEIGNDAFTNYTSLKKLKIGQSVKKIGVNAFSNSKENPNEILDQLCIPDNVEIIGKGAFMNYNCLTKLTLSNNLTVIEESVFACSEEKPNESMRELVIPKSVKRIKSRAFANYKNLDKITVSFETEVDKDAFIGCDKLNR